MADNKDFSNKESNTGDAHKKNDIALREEAILEFWNSHNIFKKTEEKDSPKGEYVFYDGPPFATGLPHYGHLLAGTIKDAIPRYQTMRGHRVIRRWGWDCHGLPLENQIEEELNLKTKRDIEEIGIGKFNEAARNAVLRYAGDWKKIVPRLGRFVDMERDYKTMDTSYTESVWWIFKTLYDKKLIYKGFKSMHLCPRCGTTLSNFEVNQGYKDITDISVYVKLELKNEPGVHLLIWTTTPWTLPGNMAAAVNKDVTYVKVKTGEHTLILAKDRLSVLNEEYSIIEEFKGGKLVGKYYVPPFDYFENVDLKGKKNAWKIYHADYVSTEDGTGVVHLAPAFGEEDLVLAQQNGIPIVHHVNPGGEFVKEIKDFVGLQAKPKEDPQKTDIEIIKALAHKGVLFAKEKIIHSYPFCWRCHTPLLNYASSSWFVRVAKFKDKLVSENKKVGWVPKEVGENRFGNWLEGARDWAISRSRYWGAPLPVWENKKDNSYLALGSIDELKKYTKKSGNTYFTMRHGEADSNVQHVLSTKKENTHHLTASGREQVELSVKKLRDIDLIFTSPFVRTKESAEIIRKALGLKADQVIEDDRLSEIKADEFNNRPIKEWFAFFVTLGEKFIKRPLGGENLDDIRKRTGDFLYELENKYSDKKVLIVSHGDTLWMLRSVASGYTKEEILSEELSDYYPQNGVIKELSFIPLPHNKNYELDLHRPYIDDIEVVDGRGNPLERVQEVFDCWFESGSMPYAQQHYPFENANIFEPRGGLFSKSKGYPADFIAEGMDQTRGWFYSLIVLGVGLFGKAPYKNVIVNGLVLAEDGQKMSKSLKNYPDPVEVINKYGADTLRYYLLSSPIVRGEDLSFSEKGVDEIMKKILIRLSNVSSFYELYREDIHEEVKSTHVIDLWILERTKELTNEVTSAMDKYELDKATRPINMFIDDLSTWYIRRSRDRFKGEDKIHALSTTRTALHQLSKVMAPFMPFYAEILYQSVKEVADPESVHLCDWPEKESVDDEILGEMQQVRDIISLALEARATAGIKVRQPLKELKVKSIKLKGKDELLSLIKDEVNVKSVVVDSEINNEVVLDTELTEELKREGLVRDIVRQIQQFRKNSNLTPQDRITLIIDTDEDCKKIIETAKEDIKRTALIKEIIFDSVSDEGATIDGKRIAFAIK